MLILNLATELRELGTPAARAEAAPLFREALAARRLRLGPRHKRTLAAATGYAFLLRELGQLEAARPLFLEAFEGYRATLGARDPVALTAMDNYVAFLEESGVEGADALRRALLHGGFWR